METQKELLKVESNWGQPDYLTPVFENKKDKQKVFERDKKKLSKLWNEIKTRNVVFKIFKVESKQPYNGCQFVKLIHMNHKFWLADANSLFDISKVNPTSEILGGHKYQDGNFNFTTKDNTSITCEPFYGKESKVKKNGSKQRLIKR